MLKIFSILFYKFTMLQLEILGFQFEHFIFIIIAILMLMMFYCFTIVGKFLNVFYQQKIVVFYNIFFLSLVIFVVFHALNRQNMENIYYLLFFYFILHIIMMIYLLIHHFKNTIKKI